ncbi:hypothetical protein GCM10010358_37470 [Streptomyces minutiscleroticus]|uniref:Uncharacterized protein n=2 Tax=Streptomyces minutiscleroticus TaxID=68238 RepID=A0A918U0M0_9ACTN|nr:hypothetical protein GCM10010358_37470 [Streptomyces minutiscleroticus]
MCVGKSAARRLWRWRASPLRRRDDAVEVWATLVMWTVVIIGGTLVGLMRRTPPPRRPRGSAPLSGEGVSFLLNGALLAQAACCGAAQHIFTAVAGPGLQPAGHRGTAPIHTRAREGAEQAGAGHGLAAERALPRGEPLSASVGQSLAPVGEPSPSARLTLALAGGMGVLARPAAAPVPDRSA